MSDQQQFNEWAVLELFGHQRLAGRVTAVTLGGASFVRVDVPDIEIELKGAVKLTKFLNPSAIYSITPVTEETVRAVAKSCSSAPVTRWDVHELIDRVQKRLSTDEPSYDMTEEGR